MLQYCGKLVNKFVFCGKVDKQWIQKASFYTLQFYKKHGNNGVINEFTDSIINTTKFINL